MRITDAGKHQKKTGGYRMSMKRLVVCMLVLCMSMLYCAAALGEEEITIRYSYWGSSYENDAMQKIAASYEALHPNVHIECVYIPNAELCSSFCSSYTKARRSF